MKWNGFQLLIYTSVLVTASRMLTFPSPKVVILICVMLYNRRKCLILYENLCDVAIVDNYCFIRY